MTVKTEAELVQEAKQMNKDLAAGDIDAGLTDLDKLATDGHDTAVATGQNEGELADRVLQQAAQTESEGSNSAE